MQVWPPKELSITQLTDETPIRGVTMYKFKTILKRGFAQMYANSQMNDVDPARYQHGDCN